MGLEEFVVLELVLLQCGCYMREILSTIISCMFVLLIEGI